MSLATSDAALSDAVIAADPGPWRRGAASPEGTVNRDPRQLVPGHSAAAPLSLDIGVPVLPVGVRFFDQHRDSRRRASGQPIGIHIGSRPTPPEMSSSAASLADVRAWHGEIMTAIAALCGKTCPPR